jgi:DtxR family Mn-dependent transcriptional regulator
MSADRKSPGYSRSTEDYLKAIYELESEDRAAQTSAIAEALDVAPPSVSGMVKRLSESGLLEHVPYRGVQLTRAGRRAALRMMRRHRILETYLTSKLGYDWDSVHEEAERLEHAVSDELVERMAMALGYPQYDPHGAPIPTKDGEIEEPADLLLLSEVPVGQVAELRMVSDRDPDLLRYVASLGLRVGVVFEVIGRQPFRGPTAIRLAVGHGREQHDHVIGHELAEHLSCLVLEGDVV